MKKIWFIFLTPLCFLVLSQTIQARVSQSPRLPATPVVKKKAVSAKRSRKLKLNLNRIDAEVLAAQVKGIGRKRARAIIAYREAHGSFKNVADLVKVKGIGARFMQKNQAYLRATLSV